MNDRLDTTTTFDASDADDRIDALARSAGSALRRPADAGHLARIHRAKRNHQIARATGGAAAVLAVVGGAVVLMNRGGEERLVPATVPSTVVVETLPTTTPVTVGSSVPTSAPSTAPVTSPATTPVTSPVTDPPVTTSPPVNTATGEQPQFLYVGTQTTGTDEQQVLDFATGQVIRTEPMEQDQSLTATPPRPEPRTTSASGIEYALDLSSTDGCGQMPVSVTGAGSALPERASLLQVSGDGRRVLTMSAPECPRPDELGPDEALFGTAVPHQQEIRLFDADDPSAAGIVLDTVTMRGYEGTLAEFSADGRFVVLSPLGVDGTDTTSIVAYDLETGDAIVLDDGDCLLGAGFQRGPSAFVGEQSVVALTEQCDDGWHVEITSLYEPGNTAEWIVPGVSADEVVAVGLEVWEQSLTAAADATFTVSVSNGLDATGSRLLVRRTGGELEQLPEGGTIVSFLPIWDTVGS